jgi:hypothetical protein
MVYNMKKTILIYIYFSIIFIITLFIFNIIIYFYDYLGSNNKISNIILKLIYIMVFLNLLDNFYIKIAKYFEKKFVIIKISNKFLINILLTILLIYLFDKNLTIFIKILNIFYSIYLHFTSERNYYCNL